MRFFITRIIIVILMGTYACPLWAQENTIASEPVASAYFTNDSHALVVGVSNYVSWPVLPNAIQDAKEVASLLKHGGFNVTLLTDPSALELKGALNYFTNMTGQEENRSILFYYSGHGETQILSSGKMLGWIIPKDCPLPRMDPPGFEKKAVSTRAIEAYSRQIRSKHVLMLFDSSFSGDEFKLTSPALKLIGKKSLRPTRQVIVAGRADEPVPDRSMFKRYLMQGLLGSADAFPDGYITGSELGVYLSQWVTRSTKGSQYPQFANLGDPEQAHGDFIMQQIEPLPVPKKGMLRVDTDPVNARIRILNIQPKFKQGIELAAGRYHVEVSSKGYKTHKQWIRINAGEEKKLTYQLKKEEGVYTNFLGMRFVSIKPGTYTMGTPEGVNPRGDGETAHQISISKEYFMQTTEVTVGQFGKFVKATGYKTEAEASGASWVGTKQDRWKKKKGSNWRKPIPGENARPPENSPVSCVTWNDTKAFVEWLGKKDGKAYSLPTEAQWEYACRAGTDTQFSYGDCLSTDQANYGRVGSAFAGCEKHFKQQRSGPLAVASLSPNQWGLYDLHGNVAEWCQDWYGLYEVGLAKDPGGPSSGTERVIRGGHYFNNAHACRSASRLSFASAFAANVIGFRVVLNP